MGNGKYRIVEIEFEDGEKKYAVEKFNPKAKEEWLQWKSVVTFPTLELAREAKTRRETRDSISKKVVE